jgi:hypothetical protein
MKSKITRRKHTVLLVRALSSNDVVDPTSCVESFNVLSVAPSALVFESPVVVNAASLD